MGRAFLCTITLFLPAVSPLVIQLPSQIAAHAFVSAQWTRLPSDPLAWNFIFSMDGVDNAGFAATVATVGELQGTTNITFPLEGQIFLKAVSENNISHEIARSNVVQVGPPAASTSTDPTSSSSQSLSQSTPNTALPSAPYPPSSVPSTSSTSSHHTPNPTTRESVSSPISSSTSSSSSQPTTSTTTSLVTSPSPNSASAAKRTSNTSAIVGGVIGGVVLFLVAFIVVAVLRRRQQRSRRSAAFNPELMFKQRESLSPMSNSAVTPSL